MLATRKRPLPLLAALTLVLVVIFYHRDHADRLYQQWSTSIESHPMKLPSNSTLGFGAVIVVSKDGSERRHALLPTLISPSQPSRSGPKATCSASSMVKITFSEAQY
jgi:hypothetical protein